MSTIKLDESEIAFLAECPDALDALAVYHSVQATMADGMGMGGSVKFHEKRAVEISLAAGDLREAIEDGR